MCVNVTLLHHLVEMVASVKTNMICTYDMMSASLHAHSKCNYVLLIFRTALCSHVSAKVYSSLSSSVMSQSKMRKNDTLICRCNRPRTPPSCFFCFLARVSCWKPQCLWPPCPAEAQLYLTVILLCQPESLLLAAWPSRGPTGRIRRGAGVLFACLFWMCMCACVFTEGEAKWDV